MKIHAPEETIRAALETANREYDGNLTFRTSAYGTKPFARRGPAFLVTLGVQDSKAPGHRRAMPRAEGKPGARMAYACWHAHRDFLRALFALAPDARVQTALADYRGRAAFEREFPATDRPAAGPLHPFGHLRFSDLCDCAGAA